MRVYVLHLKGPAAVSRAFERLMASSRIGSCLVEPEHNRVRFLAPPEGQRTDVWPVDRPAAGADC